MDPSPGPKRRKLTPVGFEKSFPASSTTTEKSVEISTHDSPISHLPQELLSAIIDYVPKTQWPSLELVNRSFRDAMYSNWQSLKEFDIIKNVLNIRQLLKGVCLSDFLPSILAKLLLRSPMLTSIIGLPFIPHNKRSEIQQTIRQFTNFKRIDFGICGIISTVELVNFLTSLASRDRLVEINSSADYQVTCCQNWPAIFTDRENSESQVSRLKLEKLCLKNEYQSIRGFLDPRIIDLIDPSSLKVLVLDKIAPPSDYLLSLITSFNQLQQLQFSFRNSCLCKESPCVHLASSMEILEAIAAMECLDSLKIGFIENDCCVDNRHYLAIEDKLPVLIVRLGQRGRLVEFGLLNKYYCSDQVIDGIVDHLGALKSLELSTQFCCPPTLVSMIKKMVSLEKLTFSCAVSAEISPLFKAMATHLQKLRSFNLRFSTIDIDCRLDINELTRLERLEELSIVGAFCNNIEWESTFGHQLRSLELRTSHENLVAAFLTQVPGLRRLVLSGYMPQNKVFRMIPTTCPGLRELHIHPALGFCGNSIKDGIQAIIDGCPEFEQLVC